MKKETILIGSDKNAVVALLSIHFVVFIFFRMMYIIFQNDPETFMHDYLNLIDKFTLPGSFHLFITKVWTLVLYFFCNSTLLGLVTNMVWLLVFAYLMQKIGLNKNIFPAYILGGIFAGIVFIISNNFLKNDASLLSSTPAIIALATTLTTYKPNFKLLPNLANGIPIWILFIVFMAINLITLYQNVSLIPTYIAAIIFGFIYGKALLNGNDFGKFLHQIYNTFLGK